MASLKEKNNTNFGIKINGLKLEEYDSKIYGIMHKYFGRTFPYRKDLEDMFSEKGLVINNYILKVIGNVNNIYLEIKYEGKKPFRFCYSPHEFRNKFWLRNIRLSQTVKDWLEKLHSKYTLLEKPEKPKPLIRRRYTKELLGKDAVFCFRKRHYVLVEDICLSCSNYKGMEKRYNFREKQFKKIHLCQD